MAGFEPTQFGKYYLLEKLAVGGMAEIYKAKTFGVDGFEKLLALKKILPHCSADKDFIMMLADEAKLAVLLSHANIVQVYDLGKVGEDYFISMEYINGPNLRDIIYRCREKNLNIPVELIVFITSEICKGLDYAHRKTDQNNKPLNIVHRDVSPQNVLISYEGEVKIVDFGIAKAAMNISHTMAGILKGKIAYMSPEQALGKTIDHRTDIFSVGILLYEMLTQKKLFTGESQFEVLKKIRTTKFDASQISGDVPAALRGILAKALSYYPRDRYQSAGDMQIDLTRFLYQQYVDFSPQKLASFIRDLFADDLKSRQMEAAREAALAAQTSSMNIAQEALQENIVHREDTGVTMKATAVGSAPKGSGQAPISDFTTRIRRRQRVKRAVSLFTMIIIFAAAGFSYWKWLHPIWFGKVIPKTGTASISSEPPGAGVFLNGADKGLITPAILEDLELGRSYALKLKKEGYADMAYTLTATSTEPISISLTLTKEMGTLNISSLPPGAKIFINHEDTGKETPATITSLELKKELKIVLSKSGYKDFEKVETLTGMEPVRVEAKLEEIAYGEIVVTSEPSGATVLLNNKGTGKVTPARIGGLEQGKEYTIQVAKKDYTGFTRTIRLDKKELTVSGTLKKEEVVVEESTTLHVDSSPQGAAIYLGGQNTGKVTPATLSDLRVKRSYTIKLVKPNYDSWSKKVYIADKTPQTIKATLKEAGETPPPPQRGTGTIKVNSRPSGAAVFIGGVQKGTTPFTGEAPAGSISVLVTKGDSRYSAKVNVTAGQVTDLGTVALAGAFGSVYITSTPPGASVTLDGQGLGKTPITIKRVRMEGSHTISLTLSGYQAWSSSFAMENQSNKNFNVTLEK